MKLWERLRVLQLNFADFIIFVAIFIYFWQKSLAAHSRNLSIQKVEKWNIGGICVVMISYSKSSLKKLKTIQWVRNFDQFQLQKNNSLHLS